VNLKHLLAAMHLQFTLGRPDSKLYVPCIDQDSRAGDARASHMAYTHGMKHELQMVCNVRYGIEHLSRKPYEPYLCAGRAVANMVGSVQHGLPVKHAHPIPEQGRFSVALIFGALVPPVD